MGRAGRVEWTTELYRIFGVRPRELPATYQAFLEHVHPEDRGRVSRSIEAALVEKRAFEHEHRIVRPDGEVRIVSSRGDVVCGSDGQVLYMVGTCQDITEHRRSDDAIRHALSLLRSTIEGTGDAILVVDSQRHVVTFNQKLLDLWKFPPEVIGARELDAVIRFAATQVIDPETFRERLHAILDEPEPHAVDLLELKDGRIFERQINPQRFDGEVVGLVVTYRDLTALHRALDRERSSRQLAEQAVASRDELLSVASHELRTPITSLHLNVQNLLAGAFTTGEPLAADDPMARPLRAIERQSRKLLQLINEMLDVTHLSHAQLDLFLKDVDAASVVEGVCARYAEDARKAGGALKLRLARGVVGRCDEARLDQVIGALLSNAIRYAPGTTVDVTLVRDGDRARITIEDEGPGVAFEKLDTIFEKFDRAAASRNYGGLGLGLFLVREIVAQLGGRVAAENIPGGGARFTVELPLQGSKGAA